MNTVKFEKKNTLVVAHRGVSGIETENTAAAFIAAGNRTYYGIETDMYRTYDGRFALCHDRTLKRVGGENVNVENMTLGALQRIVLFDNDGTKDRADLRICSLENYLGICKKYEKHCVLELKSEFTDEETERFIGIIKDFDYLDNITFISFSYDNLLRVRKIATDQSVQFLFHECTDEILERVIADKMDIDIHHEALTEELVSHFHELGIKVNCWTVNDAERGEQLAEWGVDYITTNILE